MSILGVTNSASGKLWLAPDREIQDEAERLERIGAVDPSLARLYARLGARVENLEAFENPKLRDLLPDPHALKDCDRAAKRLLHAIQSKERIAIFGDYDVDGATSSALLIDYLRFFSLEPTLYIPDRLTEGYGPNIPAMESLGANHDLIICVDCGTLAHDAVKAARDKGADVIILDHHMAGETLPDAITVNPNRQDTDNDLGYLSAAAVVFLVLIECNRELECQKPDLLKGLDLVALSTIADVAPLQGVNRAFVRSGLDWMKRQERIGLRALTSRFLSKLSVAPSDIGFTLAPRLNAGGRVGNSLLATQLLTAQDEAEAETIVDELDALNRARQEIEREITEEAKAQIDAKRESEHFVYAYGENWHPGVLGIVASRLKAHFDAPALVIGAVEGIYHGSARSVEGIDLGSAIARLQSEKLILKGGGHKMAAGVSLRPEMIQDAMSRLDALLKRQADKRPPSSLLIDALISTQRINLEFLDKIERAGPFGAMASDPLFALSDLKLISRHVLKERHLKYRFQALHARRVNIMGFGAVGGALDIPQDAVEQNFHLVVKLSRNSWNGRESVTVMLEDWAYTGPTSS